MPCQKLKLPPGPSVNHIYAWRFPLPMFLIGTREPEGLAGVGWGKMWSAVHPVLLISEAQSTEPHGFGEPGNQIPPQALYWKLHLLNFCSLVGK